MNPSNPKPERSLYFWAILPPEEIAAEVEALRQEIATRFNTKRALRLPVHLTIYPPFRVGKEDFLLMKDMVTGWLARQNSFEIELHDFGFFNRKNPVAYVNVLLKPALLAFQKLFQNAVDAFLGAEEDRRDFNPHFTIAQQDLQQMHLPALKEFLSTQRIQAAFEVKALWLFRHDGKVWRVAERFELGE